MGQLVEDVDRDREFEERRLKIEREQELIYEQEEQHFREVVKIILNDKRPQSVFKLSQALFTRSVNPRSDSDHQSCKSSQKY